MATARECFDRDLSTSLRVHATRQVAAPDGAQGEVLTAMALDFQAGSKYAAVLLPDLESVQHIAAHFIQNIHEVLGVTDGIDVIGGFAGTDEAIPLQDLSFSGRIAFYTAAAVAPAAKQDLQALAAAQGLRIIIRDKSYVDAKSRVERPLAFISHDSRDKEPFVRELASTLQQMLCPVWYDEYSLIAGHSLRESIEKGLRECRKCVLVLSNHFLSNDGWTKAEFDSVFTREILERRNVIIPVWHGVSPEQVYAYSPRLLDKVGIPSVLGGPEVARRIVRAVDDVA